MVEQSEVFWFFDELSAETSQKLLLVEVPEKIVETVEQLAQVNHNTTTTDFSEKTEIELFRLLEGNEDDKTLTTSISPDTLLVGEIHKTSTSMVLGIMIPHTELEKNENKTIEQHNGNNNKQSALLKYATSDCFYLGEKNSYLTLQVTYPKLHNIYEKFDTQLTSKHITAEAGKRWWTLKELQSEVQAAENQLKQLFLDGYFICAPNASCDGTPIDQLLWQPATLSDILTFMNLFISGLRLTAQSSSNITLNNAASIIFSAVHRMSQLPTELKAINNIIESPIVLFQMLLFFCDADKSDFNLDSLVKISPISHAYEVFVQRLSSVIDSDITLSLNCQKVIRQIARDTVLRHDSISVEALARQVNQDIHALLPPELLDDRNEFQSDFFFSRGDGNIKVTNDTYYLRGVGNNHLNILHHICGFAIFSNERHDGLKPLFHSTLPWDWSKRLEKMFNIKSLWTIDEIDFYLKPLKELFHCPPTSEIIAKYLVRRHETCDGRPLYFNRRLVLD